VLCFATLPAFAQDEGSYYGNSATRDEIRISGLEEQLRASNGRVEQVESSLRKIEQALQRLQSDVDTRLTKLETAPPPPAPLPQPVAQPAPAVQQPVDANGSLGAIKVQNGKIVGGVNNPQAPALPSVPDDYGLTAQEQYERAFNLLRQANYPDAEEAFKSFIDKNPKDKLVDNAKYWYGETLYVRSRFDEAAVAFADAYQQNPHGSKAPDSLLKLAMSLSALDKKSDACVTLAELKSKYPSAAATVKARADEERAKLKCPAK